MSLELTAFALGIAVVIRIGRLAVLSLVPKEQENDSSGHEKEDYRFFHSLTVGLR